MSKKVDVSIEELSTFADSLANILKEFETIEAESKAVGNSDFYTKGLAKDAVSKLENISEKYLATAQHYGRLYQLINYTGQKIIDADQKLAQDIQSSGPQMM